MAKGWHRESRKHSLARRGIKTKQRVNERMLINKLADAKRPFDTPKGKRYTYVVSDFGEGKRLIIKKGWINAENKEEAGKQAEQEIKKFRTVGKDRIQLQVYEFGNIKDYKKYLKTLRG